MKANEFRIGNWVNGEFGNGEIKPFQIFRIDGNDDCSGLEPIPLTPEILEKCGLETGFGTIVYSNGKRAKEYHVPYPFVLLENGANNFYTVSFHYCCGERNEEYDVCEIQYLHQLQNLYCALTGKELEINLDDKKTEP
jgi:hypothetical protein